MLNFLFERVAKPLVLFVATFLAIRYVTKSAFDGFVIALIPGILGLTNIYVKFGYLVAALSLVALGAFVMTPPSVRDPIVGRVTHTFNDILHPPASGAAGSSAENTIAPTGDVQNTPGKSRHRVEARSNP